MLAVRIASGVDFVAARVARDLRRDTGA